MAESINKYILRIAYSGTQYAGWQEQPAAPTIAGTIQKTYERIFHHPIKVVGASRTDAGVHAYEQVARFHTHLTLDPQLIIRCLNASLPSSIVIRDCFLAPAGFHPQHNITTKCYVYNMVFHRPLPWIADYVWHVRQPVDISLMMTYLSQLIGEHDFATFVQADSNIIEPYIARIDAINSFYLQRLGIYSIKIWGNRFGRHMVRRIVGSAYEAARRKMSVEVFNEHFKSAHPERTLFVAPPSGLLLRKIIYETKF